MEKIRSVLKKLENSGLYLDIDIANIMPEMKHLVLIIEAGKSITVDLENIKAI